MNESFSKYKKALIIPYFGRFPNYFSLWLKSASANKGYDFILVTDVEFNQKLPTNVIVHKISFNSLKIKIQKLFDFPIKLNSYYKLCDFRPAYGYIFEEYLNEYDFWGYCDIDLIFGNLDHFYDDKLLECYDKISDAGHFTLYRNNEVMRKCFQINSDGCYHYKDVYSNDSNFAFDEWGNNKGINRILLNKGFKVFYNPIYFSDIRIDKYNLINTRTKYGNEENVSFELKKKNIVFEWNLNGLFQYCLIDKKIYKHEEAYIHLQKRRMIDSSTKNEFLIVPPNRFIDKSREVDVSLLLKIRNKKIYFPYLFLRIKNFFKKVGLAK